MRGQRNEGKSGCVVLSCSEENGDPGASSDGLNQEQGEGLSPSSQPTAGLGTMYMVNKQKGPHYGPAPAAQPGGFQSCRPPERPPWGSCLALPTRPHAGLVWED